MKALTILQPYAHLIVNRDKRIENRTWWTSYRGPLLIHAGKSRSMLDEDDEKVVYLLGAILGIADLYDCVKLRDIEEMSEIDQKYAYGPYCWLLRNVRAFANPIPYSGKQGLFDIPDHLIEGALRG